MARSRTARATGPDPELAAIERWYRERLTAPAVVPMLRWAPVYIGPTWARDGDRWLLPDRTLGWDALAWCGRWLQLRRGTPWTFTDEQARFVLHWYALDEQGRFLYRDGVLQRLKGWGKDPLGAALSSLELLGPCRFGGFERGRPVGVPAAEPWVQTAAVSLEQTKNTMRLLPGLVTAEAKEQYRVQIGKETVYALGDAAFMQAVTSSPTTLEGARASFVLPNETQHWDSSNAGHDMADVIERNATKSADGAARSLRITNAYEPGLDSVAERDREAWEAARDGRSVDVGLLYDSVEAPPEAPLSADAAPSVVESIRGDSVWLSTERIVSSILDPRNPPSRSRRFWYNQITAAEDAWALPADIKRAADAGTGLEIGPREPVVAFFDGSKSDDSTGLVVVRLSDGHAVTRGIWQRPTGERGKGWIVPRGEVDAAVETMFTDHQVRAFWADPSDARDDSHERFWEPLVDDWHRRFGHRLEAWAVQTGNRRHSVAWDMRDPAHDKDFTLAAMRAVSELEAGQVSYDGHPAMTAHLRNARRRPNRHGVSLAKEHRESSRKVDLAVCLVGARMLRRVVLNREAGTRQRTGRVV